MSSSLLLRVKRTLIGVNRSVDQIIIESFVPSCLLSFQFNSSFVCWLVDWFVCVADSLAGLGFQSGDDNHSHFHKLNRNLHCRGGRRGYTKRKVYRKFLIRQHKARSASDDHSLSLYNA